MFQHKYYNVLTFLANFIVVGSVGWYFHDFFGAVVFAFLARVFVTHHLTWFINSLAHTLGTQPYSQEHSGVNNAFIAFLTFGEGYHNYHHTFPSDYRNGVHWYQFDPTKVLIWCLAKIGIASNLKKIELPLIKRRMILEDKRKLVEKIRTAGCQTWADLENKVKKTAESLSAKLSEKYRLMAQYRTRTKEWQREERRNLKTKLKHIRKSIHEEYKQWTRLYSEVVMKTSHAKV
jgi:stearoyl-CoA desaturase (delta-9 desaturase)